MAPSITSVSLWNQASCSSKPPGLTMTSPRPPKKHGRASSVNSSWNVAHLERASAVDLAENIGRQLAADTRYTDQGRQDQFKNHVLHQAVPVFSSGPSRDLSREAGA